MRPFLAPLAIAATLSLGAGSCGVPTFRFLSPAQGQLSLAGSMAAELNLPTTAVPGTLAVQLDGQDVTALFASGTPTRRSAALAGTTAGRHVLAAQVQVSVAFLPVQVPISTQTTFEGLALHSPETCEVLNDVECLLPFPSSRFLVPAATPTGVRVALPAEGLPQLVGEPLDPGRFGALDGFSPTAHLLMHFPGGVSVEQSNAPRLLAPGCCGQPGGPPWVDTRTTDDRSLDSDSPTVLLDADTGERVLHFVELDARAKNKRARQVLILRPGKSLTPGRRYIVAVRGLVHDDGSPVVAEAPFAALRDARPTDIPTLVARRAHFEDLFTRLERFGVPRGDLQLAWDFTVRSDHALTHQMLEMRDAAFAWLATVQADPSAVPFTVTSVSEVSTCSAPGDVVWREVRGTFKSPLFLAGVPLHEANAPADELVVDASDVPQQNFAVNGGFMDAPFTLSLPCRVREAGAEVHPLVLGHGAFGQGSDMVGLARSIASQLPRFGGLGEWRYIAGATDWQVICCGFGGILWIVSSTLGLGENQFNHFEALPDRTKQGELNTLVLARLMKRGLFNRHPDFRVPDGHGGTRGVFPGEADPTNEAYYYGISLGGIYGLFFAALTPDIERFHLDVPAMNFSYLLQRSTLFAAPLAAGVSFESVLRSIGLTDPLDTLLLYALAHEVWVSGEPAGYATHVTKDPLPGSSPDPIHRTGKKILFTPAWLDKTVPNAPTEVAARTLGLPQLAGSTQKGMPGIPDAAGPLDSALVMWDLGSFDLFDPADQVHIPPLSNAVATTACDPHGARWSVPAGIQQMLEFLRPGGQIRNTCRDDGQCNASEPYEISGGEAQPCQLPAPPTP